jgi:hypothetical protein
MRRHLIGITAILLLLLAVITTLWPSHGAGGQWYESMSWRLGAVMAFWWLAYPEAVKLPVWLWFVLPGMLAALFIRGPARWVILVLLAAMVVLTMLQPRPKNRGREGESGRRGENRVRP